MAAWGVTERRVISSFNFNCNFFPKTLCYCTITEKMCDIFTKRIEEGARKKEKKRISAKKELPIFFLLQSFVDK